MKIAVSIAALAAALMISPAMAQPAPAPTAAEADAFLAKVEKAMFDHSLISQPGRLDQFHLYQRRQ